VLILDPRKLDDVVTVLYEHDFEVEVLDFISEDGARWLKVRVLSHRGDDSFLLWLLNMIDPFGAMLTEDAEQ
jgi:hypothetical protein